MEEVLSLTIMILFTLWICFGHKFLDTKTKMRQCTAKVWKTLEEDMDDVIIIDITETKTCDRVTETWIIGESYKYLLEWKKPIYTVATSYNHS